MLTSFEEWKNSKLDEFQDSMVNTRGIGRAIGTTAAIANPMYMKFLKPKIDGLWRMKVYKAENENPGSTADPGRMRQMQDEFIKELTVVIMKSVKGNDAGAGRTVNFASTKMNPDVNPSIPPRAMGQGPQLQ